MNGETFFLMTMTAEVVNCDLVYAGNRVNDSKIAKLHYWNFTALNAGGVGILLLLFHIFTSILIQLIISSPGLLILLFLLLQFLRNPVWSLLLGCVQKWCSYYTDRPADVLLRPLPETSLQVLYMILVSTDRLNTWVAPILILWLLHNQPRI